MTVTAQSETAPPPAEPSFEQLAARADDAMRAVAGLDGPARAVAEELKAAVEAVHRAGLVTIVRRMRADDGARELLFELVDDPVVHLLLSLHGIVRPDPVTMADRVLEGVRPQLQSHGGDVKLVMVEESVAFVQLEGACNGCSMSSVTLRNLVEEALVEGVPSITKVVVVPNAPSPALIPLESLRIGLGSGAVTMAGNLSVNQTANLAADSWAKAGPASDLVAGKISPLRIASGSGQTTDVIVVNIDERLTAYHNACAHEGMPLDNALLDVESGTLTCPWHGFCYDALSGECLSAPGAQLEQLPLRVDAGDVWIRVGR
jgi:Fe-S cluster biogenesis protein NfuA/nitrite reductase/ring-hydroxylating ferredoxin subunit